MTHKTRHVGAGVRASRLAEIVREFDAAPATPAGSREPAGQLLSAERIEHLWDTHVGWPTAQSPLSVADVLRFARVIENECRLTRPAGWKLVPIEPTEAMLAAAHDMAGSMRFNPLGPDYWRAMLNASPVLAGSRAAETASPNSVHQAEASAQAPGAADGDEVDARDAKRWRWARNNPIVLDDFSFYVDAEVEEFVDAQIAAMKEQA